MNFLTIRNRKKQAYGGKHLRYSPRFSQIKGNVTEPGERIELKVNRMVRNGEPINDTKLEVFTERKDGIDPLTNVRTRS